MSTIMIISFLSTGMTLIGLSAIYSVSPFFQKIKPLQRKILSGLLIGVIGVVTIMNSYVYADGIRYDLRSVIASISGMFFGVVPTIIATSSMVVTRIIIGGDGMYAGISSILTAASVGLIWRHTRLKPHLAEERSIHYLELLAVSIVSSTVVLFSQFLLPNSRFLDILPEIILPIGVIFSLIQWSIAVFIYSQRKTYFNILRDKQLKEQYRRMFLESPIIQFILEPGSGVIRDVNIAALKAYGYLRDEFLQLNIYQLSTKNDISLKNAIDNAMKGNSTLIETIHKTKENQELYLEIQAGPIRMGNEYLLLVQATNKTDEQKTKAQFEQLDERYRKTLMAMTEGVIVIDNNRRIQLTNKAAARFLSGEGSLIGEKIEDHLFIKRVKDNLPFSNILFNVIKQGITYDTDKDTEFLLEKEDDMIYIDFTLTPLHINEEEIFGYVILIQDVTEQYLYYAEMERVSNIDYLTGLYNRSFFDTECKRLDTKRQYPLSVIMCDVNGLKLLNDAYSHIKGDDLLNEIAKILTKSVREEDIVSRWGGDEYAILLPQTSEEGVKRIIKRIESNLAKSTFKPIKPSIALGYATKDNENISFSNILKDAEDRMYREKDSKSNEVRLQMLNQLIDTFKETYPELYNHSEHVKELAVKFGKHLKLSDDDLHILKQSALLHNLGIMTLEKEDINIKSNDLIKLERYSNKIYNTTRILQNISGYSSISDVISLYIERYDADGVFGRSKDEIPLLSRVLLIIDHFDLLTEKYDFQEKNYPYKEAKQIMMKSKGLLYDPILLEEFFKLMETTN